MPQIPDVEPWEGEPVKAIVCVTVKQGTRPIAGSIMIQCQDCNEDVWFSPSSNAVLEKYPNTPALCIACALTRTQKEKE